MSADASPFYETDRAVSEYLLFHYGTADEILPYEFGPRDALDYPVRCVTDCLDATALPENARALDLGCAVGRSSFELARHCAEVVGIDYSHRFIETANRLRSSGELSFAHAVEGDVTASSTARIDSEIDRARVRFQQGDAMNLPGDLGTFDVVLMANLVDRLAEPKRCLDRLAELVNPGGQLIVTSPYTWLEDYTPKNNWLGGRISNGESVRTGDALVAALAPDFDFRERKDLPFLIREHARKYQWSVAEATIMTRRTTA